MNNNSVMPSLDKIMNAVNSDLIDHRKNQVQVPDSNRGLLDKNELIFDATKWYLQDYPNKVDSKKVKMKKEDIDKPISSISNDDKMPKKSGVGKTIAVLIAIVSLVLIGFCLYFFYESSNYTEPYHDTAVYEENSYYDMELTVGSSDTRYIDLDEIIIYSFIPTVSGEYTFYSTSDNTDPDCEVYNSSKENIAEDHEYGDVHISNNFIAGETYYFQVYVYENGANVTVNLD